jgi:hypothetical protein
MTLLAQVNWILLVVYTIVDHAAFLLYKLARGDLAYWIPGFGHPLSLFLRLLVKVIVDFTGTFSGLSTPCTSSSAHIERARVFGLAGCVHFRHPLELGGTGPTGPAGPTGPDAPAAPKFTG